KRPRYKTVFLARGEVVLTAMSRISHNSICIALHFLGEGMPSFLDSVNTQTTDAQPPPSCKSTLLSFLPDSAFSASSSVAQKFSAAAAKMASGDSKLQYRAWCPENVQPHEEKEYLEVDFGRQSFVKLIITKGLSTADKGGLYLTPFYYIWYRRGDSNSEWIKYQNINGTTRIKGNLDAQTERYVSMNPPFVARWVRIYPFTQERQPVCLKLEIVGCSASRNPFTASSVFAK
ncbi:hypothetical protein ACTXT7_004590, partial [Hymenolepis weldensis]